MLNELKAGLKETGDYLYLALKALYFWRREPPLLTVAGLVAYVETRSKFVAQTTLFGYVKTRVGTRYVAMYEDPVFTESVNIAKWEIWLACLGDLAIWATAGVARGSAAKPAELAALAIHIVDSATLTEEIPAERPQGFADIRDAHAARARATDWAGAGDGVFEASLSALVEWSPIADELKIHDVAIIRNSMHFKWKKVRDQFAQMLDAEAVLADWRSGNAEGSRPAPESTAEQGTSGS